MNRLRIRSSAFLAVMATLIIGAGCSSPSHPANTAPSGASNSPPPTLDTSSSTVWLCFPGRSPDPCNGNLDTTEVMANGTRTIKHVAAAANPKIDCFYVYPTVSAEDTGNADLTIGPEETGVAIAQAQRFSQVCRVYAPLYRQVTVHALFGSTTPPPNPALAYGDVQSAWNDYLAHYNDGRGVVLIGHSQGAFILTSLIQKEISPNPAQRKLLVSAILLGGNVTVPIGKTVGADFNNIAACTAASETGCVIAYSSFDQTPPPNSLFGRTSTAGDQVLCVNPAAPGSNGPAPLDPEFPVGQGGLFVFASPPGITTGWVSYPGLYTGTCMNQGGASWLQIDHATIPGDTRPVVGDALGPTWGLHIADMNIALYNLVALVQAESNAWR